MSDFAAIRFQPQRPLLRELSADRLNTILKEIRQNRPRGGGGITVRQSGEGTFISLAAEATGGRGGGGQAEHPFKILVRPQPQSDPENPDYFLRVLPGTINTLLPSNIFDGSDLNEFSLPGNSMRYVVLTASSGGAQITSATISVDSQPPSAQTPTVFGLPTTAAFLIGVVYNSAVYQIIKNVITVSGKQQYISSRTAAPGELPYNIHYVWA